MNERMNKQEIEQVRFWVWDNLKKAMDNYYAIQISGNDSFIDLVCEDIELTSGWQEQRLFNEFDVRMAIGRILCDNLGIDY